MFARCVRSLTLPRRVRAICLAAATLTRQATTCARRRRTSFATPGLTRSPAATSKRSGSQRPVPVSRVRRRARAVWLCVRLLAGAHTPIWHAVCAPAQAQNAAAKMQKAAAEEVRLEATPANRLRLIRVVVDLLRDGETPMMVRRRKRRPRSSPPLAAPPRRPRSPPPLAAPACRPRTPPPHAASARRLRSPPPHAAPTHLPAALLTSELGTGVQGLARLGPKRTSAAGRGRSAAHNAMAVRFRTSARRRCW